MDDGRWTMDDGRWTMDDGQWTMDDGRFLLQSKHLNLHTFALVFCFHLYCISLCTTANNNSNLISR